MKAVVAIRLVMTNVNVLFMAALLVSRPHSMKHNFILPLEPLFAVRPRTAQPESAPHSASPAQTFSLVWWAGKTRSAIVNP